MILHLPMPIAYPFRVFLAWHYTNFRQLICAQIHVHASKKLLKFNKIFDNVPEIRQRLNERKVID